MSDDRPQHTNLLVQSAGIHSQRLVILPWNRSDNYLQKVTSLRDWAQHQCPQSIVMLTDAYDTFMSCNAARILRTFRALRTGVLFSVEQLWSWQQDEDKPYYDGIARGPYRYLNAGGFIGYVSALLPLLRETKFVRFYKGADQVAYSHLLATRSNEFNVSFDYDSKVFYVVSGPDWSSSGLRDARINHSRPCVMHVPWVLLPRNNATLHTLFLKYSLGTGDHHVAVGGVSSSPPWGF